MSPSSTTKGLVYGIICYLIWGFQAVYVNSLAPANAIEVVAHRVIWTSVICYIVAACTHNLGDIGRIIRDHALLARLGLAAAFLSLNLITYFYAIFTGRLLDAALGSFINPLVTVVIGVLILKEKLHIPQWVAVAVATVAVIIITLGSHEFPWIAIINALCFSMYGYIKKQVGPQVGALPGIAIESAFMSVAAIPYLVVLGVQGHSHFIGYGTWVTIGLLGMGFVGAVPLVLFGAAARRLLLTTMGLMQYINPCIQFIIGVWLWHEAMSPERWIGFVLVWFALIVFIVDGVRTQHTFSHFHLAHH